jgi:replication fork clamp-binding protein CrfC
MSKKELHAITQDFIDELGWLGTLREISVVVKDNRIEKAIAILKSEMNMEQAITSYGLEAIIDSLLINAEAKNTSKPCPQAVIDKLAISK